MKTAYAIGLAVLTGLGGFGVNSLSAQTKPPAYIVADNEVSDMTAYTKELAPVAERTIKAAGGKFLARGTAEVLSGDTSAKRLVIVQFPTMDDLQKWWKNSEWQAAHKAAEKYVKFHDMAIEGVANP